MTFVTPLSGIKWIVASSYLVKLRRTIHQWRRPRVNVLFTCVSSKHVIENENESLQPLPSLSALVSPYLNSKRNTL